MRSLDKGACCSWRRLEALVGSRTQEMSVAATVVLPPSEWTSKEEDGGKGS